LQGLLAGAAHALEHQVPGIAAAFLGGKSHVSRPAARR
jgi:hypothetical protein